MSKKLLMIALIGLFSISSWFITIAGCQLSPKTPTEQSQSDNVINEKTTDNNTGGVVGQVKVAMNDHMLANSTFGSFKSQIAEKGNRTIVNIKNNNPYLVMILILALIGLGFLYYRSVRALRIKDMVLNRILELIEYCDTTDKVKVESLKIANHNDDFKEAIKDKVLKLNDEKLKKV